MANYEFKNGRFVISDYQHAKTFASFLPAVAGVDGKPLWAFFANVGQGMGGFGVTSKDTPITPFDSANLAYGNIPVKGFRTFVKEGGIKSTPFFYSGHEDSMSISMADFAIDEQTPTMDISILYSAIPHEDYPALIRKMTLTNTSKEEKEFIVLDGVPVFFPNGLSNYCYKELVSLMAAYCQVYGLEEKAPFVKFKTSTGDNSVVEETVSGNGFFAIDQNGDYLNPIVDPNVVFGNDMTFLKAAQFFDSSFEDFIGEEQQKENKLPCAFYAFKKTLKPGESYIVYSVYGMWDTFERYLSAKDDLTVSKIEKAIADNQKLIASLVGSATCHTGNPLFDLYLKQSYLDNDLRGGFPTLLNDTKDGQVYYVYGRKHGDMERDYNAFQIPSRFYSSGPGNFRDVNQNRRSDLFFHPFVKDYNVKIFFNLIQVDGQNPLNVRPNCFKNDQAAVRDLLEPSLGDDAKEISKRAGKFEPSALYTFLRDEKKYEKEKADKVFAEILSISHQDIQANFAEGYWVDHWTYNVDLLEDYSSVFPDKEEALFFTKDYSYFYDPVYVEPRDEKYCFVEEGKIRQYGAVDLRKLKDKCEKTGFDLKETNWLKTSDGKRIYVDLASKIINLIMVKFSTLDSEQLGIEMECEKPGWNDAMNGLPGLFSSGLSETVELLRLVRYAEKHLMPFARNSVLMMPAQVDMYLGLRDALHMLNAGEITRFEYWDKATTLRENLRKTYLDYGENTISEVELVHILAFLKEIDSLLSSSIQRAKVIGKGILPSYLIYRVASYEFTGRTNHLGYKTVRATSFALETIPPFLEASARALKLADGSISLKDCATINDSDLYDKKLGFYKTCAAIDDAPFEIGRVHAFTKGWLERECNFLHMDYKYLLGLLEAGYYEEFFREAAINLVYHMDPNVYGRNPVEASSFLIPTCNPDKSKHGRGYFARLTGANAEFLDMYVRLFAGKNLFGMKDGKLTFSLEPKLPASFFDKNDEVSFLLFSKTTITYRNPLKLDCYKGVKLAYVIEGKGYDEVVGSLAERIRSGEIASLEVEVSKR